VSLPKAMLRSRSMQITQKLLHLETVFGLHSLHLAAAPALLLQPDRRLERPQLTWDGRQSALTNRINRAEQKAAWVVSSHRRRARAAGRQRVVQPRCPPPAAPPAALHCLAPAAPLAPSMHRGVLLTPPRRQKMRILLLTTRVLRRPPPPMTTIPPAHTAVNSELGALGDGYWVMGDG
jgi:hypothetical protein